MCTDCMHTYLYKCTYNRDVLMSGGAVCTSDGLTMYPPTPKRMYKLVMTVRATVNSLECVWKRGGEAGGVQQLQEKVSSVFTCVIADSITPHPL